MRIQLTRIALAAAALLLAGTLAAAGDVRPAGSEGVRAAGAADGRDAAGTADRSGVLDPDGRGPDGAFMDRTDICGSPGADDKCRPRPFGQPSKNEGHSRFVGVCLPYPVLGRLFCW